MSARPAPIAAVPEAASAPRAEAAAGVFVPHVTTHCFAATAESAALFERFATDRRMSRATVEVVVGGVAAAIRRYEGESTPGLVVIEAVEGGDTLLFEIDRLAEHCDPSTQVVVVGHANDIALFRALMARGVADYLLAPVDPIALVSTALRLFRPGDEAARIGRVVSVIAAKGGVGSSTIADNVAWCLAENNRADTLLIDLDLSFGAASVSFNLEPSRGIADALRDVGRLDSALLERLMTRRGKHLCLLPAPAALDLVEEPSERAIETLLDIARRSLPFVVVDLPHHWNGWIRTTLAASDAVALVVSPGLAAARNAVRLLETLKTLRPNDPTPVVVVNGAGASRKGELSLPELKEALGVKTVHVFDSDPALFGAADAAGAPIVERAASGRLRSRFDALALDLSGRKPAAVRAAGRFDLGLGRLLGRRR
jgi:pilus assembly protein CpaE